MRHNGEALVSTDTAVELLIIAINRGLEIYNSAVDLLARPFIHLVRVDEARLWAAVAAHRNYGRGHHSAGLNFGVTFACSLASGRFRHLLFKGDDFARTDIAAAATPG